MAELLPTDEHICGVFDSPRGYQPRCSCGWVGYETDRMSNDFAWTNANDQTIEHRRKIRDERRGGLAQMLEDLEHEEDPRE